MKNISKKKLAVRAAALLIVIILVIASGLAFLSYKNDIQNLKNAITEQKKQVDSLQIDVRAINGENGMSLSRCLDEAARVYSNELSSTGDTKVENGQRTTYHSLDDWQSINKRYDAARSKCNTQYK